MRHTFILIVCLTALTSGLFAQTVVREPGFVPNSPQIMGQGGSFTANAQGYYALFTNPAAFGRGRDSLTLVTASPWVYAPPDASIVDKFDGIDDDIGAALSGLGGYLTGNGLGAGAHVGFGYVGNNFGLGLAGIFDTYASGPNVFGVQVDTRLTLGVVGGISIPIHLGPITLYAGGSVRPMYRISAYNVGLMELGELMSGEPGVSVNTPAYQGVGLGFDAAVMADFGPLTGAVAIRDLFGTRFMYSASTVSKLLSALEAGGLPEDAEEIGDDVQFITPMTMHTSLAFRPDLGWLSFFVDPTVHMEYALVMSDVPQTFWTGLHAGAEVRLLRFVSVRAGLNQGYVTFGVGAELLFLDIQAAYFSRELGPFAGARQNQGFSIEAALRF